MMVTIDNSPQRIDVWRPSTTSTCPGQVAIGVTRFARETIGVDGNSSGYPWRPGCIRGDIDFAASLARCHCPDPFFEELERRNAIVFIHPSTIPPGSDCDASPYMLYNGIAASGIPLFATSSLMPAGPCRTWRGGSQARLIFPSCATAPRKATRLELLQRLYYTPRCRPRSMSFAPRYASSSPPPTSCSA